MWRRVYTVPSKARAALVLRHGYGYGVGASSVSAAPLLAVSLTPMPRRRMSMFANIKNWLSGKVGDGDSKAGPTPGAASHPSAHAQAQAHAESTVTATATGRVVLSSEQLNSKLDELMKAQKFAEAERFAAEAIANGTKLTTSGYRHLMEIAIGAGSFERVIALSNEMKDKKITPTALMFAHLLTACHQTKNPDRARQAWAAMQTAQLERKAIHYAPYLMTLGEAKDLKALRETQDELRWRDVKLPLNVYLHVAQDFLSLNEAFYAHFVLEFARKAHPREPLPSSLYQRLIPLALTRGHASVAFQCLKTLRTRDPGAASSVSNDNLLHLLTHLCKDSHLSELSSHCAYLAERKVAIPADDAKRVMNTFLDRDMLPAALSWLHQCERFAPPPSAAAPADSASTSAATAATATATTAAAAAPAPAPAEGPVDFSSPLTRYAARSIDQARAVYSEIVKRKAEHRLPITLSMVNACMDGFAALRELERTIVVFEELGDVFGLRPNVTSYNAVLYACIQKRRAQTFAKYYEALKAAADADAACKPDFRTEHELVCYYIQTNRHAEAEAEYERARQHPKVRVRRQLYRRVLRLAYEFQRNELVALIQKHMDDDSEMLKTWVKSAITESRAFAPLKPAPTTATTAATASAAAPQQPVASSSPAFTASYPHAQPHDSSDAPSDYTAADNLHANANAYGDSQPFSADETHRRSRNFAHRSRRAQSEAMAKAALHVANQSREGGASNGKRKIVLNLNDTDAPHTAPTHRRDRSDRGDRNERDRDRGAAGGRSASASAMVYDTSAEAAAVMASTYHASIVSAPFDASALKLSTTSDTTPNALFGNAKFAPPPPPPRRSPSAAAAPAAPEAAAAPKA